jgi:hypothetical protein
MILLGRGAVARVLQMLADRADEVYWFGCIVATVILAIGVADYWFGYVRLSALISWMALAAIPWVIGSVVRYILIGRW